MSRRADWLGYAGLLLLAAAAVVRLAVLDSGPLALGLAVVGVILFLLYFFISGTSIQRFLHQRSTLAGGNVLGTTLFFFGIMVLLNLLASQFKARIDVTADKLFTLAPSTVAALKAAPAPPEIKVFYPPHAPAVTQLKPILDAARAVEPRLEVTILDPAQDPLEAMKYDLRDYASLIVVGDRVETITEGGEEGFLAALLRASRPDAPRIVFLTGHGEPSLEDRQPKGLALAAAILDRRGYRVRMADLFATGFLPDSTDVVVMVGAERTPSVGELDELDRFANQGGRFLLLLDPARPVRMERLLARGGLTFLPHVLADPEQRNPQLISPTNYARHPVVRALAERGVRVALAGAGELNAEAPPQGARTEILMGTGRRTRVAGEETSVEGRRAVGAATEWPAQDDRPGRLVVVTDSEFATNGGYEVLGNGDLFLGAVQWLAEENPIFELRPRSRTDRPVVLSRQQGRALMVLVAGLLPLLVLGAGTLSWWRRR